MAARFASLSILANLIAAMPVLAGEQKPPVPDTILSEAAEAAWKDLRGLSFEEFSDRVTYLPETGKYYVNGDVAIRNEKLLKEFWEQHIREGEPKPTGDVPEFIISTVGGLDEVWDDAVKRNLTYCVSLAFGERYAQVVADMAAASAAWESAADIDFVHVPALDGTCDNATNGVQFDVRPVNADGEFYAAAFFPFDPRRDRSLVIDPSSFSPHRPELSLLGILRHELGHVIGARHEHTRPQSGRCFEDIEWREVTAYTPGSVMHYPQCGGTGDWSLDLTHSDRNGAACIYGAAAGFVIDPNVCTARGGAQPSKRTIGPDTIAQHELVSIDNFPVDPGDRVTISMTGTGDPDLYVKLGGPATLGNYDCRPFEEGAEEECSFTVPEPTATAFVAVHGYAHGTYTVLIRQQSAE